MKHEEHCLVYDLPLTKDGLLWKHLVGWWDDRTESQVNEDTERSLAPAISLREGDRTKCLRNTFYSHV